MVSRVWPTLNVRLDCSIALRLGIGEQIALSEVITSAFVLLRIAPSALICSYSFEEPSQGE